MYEDLVLRTFLRSNALGAGPEGLEAWWLSFLPKVHLDLGSLSTLGQAAGDRGLSTLGGLTGTGGVSPVIFLRVRIWVLILVPVRGKGFVGWGCRSASVKSSKIMWKRSSEEVHGMLQQVGKNQTVLDVRVPLERGLYKV